MYNQIYSCFHTKISKFQCGLLKTFNAQRYGTKRHKWYKKRDKGDVTGAVFIDISKSFKCIY